MDKEIIITGTYGFCGGREVFLGFSVASQLFKISFADVLQEEEGKGYQRRFNEKHSLDFRKYIQKPGSTTIPLTFNLRPSLDDSWKIKKNKNGSASLIIKNDEAQVLSQVDCQHRLGYLADSNVQLAFMAYIGLNQLEEMRVFNVINGKAKGLSSSLLDFHEAKLAANISREKPELFLSLKLNDDDRSPWCKRLDLGGKQISGLSRRASLRTMQKAVKRFLSETQTSRGSDLEKPYLALLDFWNAITFLLSDEWNNPRKHFLTKGIGVYALNSIAADIYNDANKKSEDCNYNFYVTRLSEFIQDFDWSNTGPLKGLGGESGVKEAISILRSLKNRGQLELISNA